MQEEIAGSVPISPSEKPISCRLEVKTAALIKSVAGNVIHLLDEPNKAVDEPLRVCRPDRKVILPTCINVGKSRSGLLVKIFDFADEDFTNQFTDRAEKMLDGMGHGQYLHKHPAEYANALLRFFGGRE